MWLIQPCYLPRIIWLHYHEPIVLIEHNYLILELGRSYGHHWRIVGVFQVSVLFIQSEPLKRVPARYIVSSNLLPGWPWITYIEKPRYVSQHIWRCLGVQQKPTHSWHVNLPSLHVTP